MKKGIFAKLGAVACVLTLVTTSLVGGTFAKYVTKTTGSVVATAAEWKVEFTKADGTTDFTQAINLEGSGAGTKKKLLPGDKGSFTVKVKGAQAEVDFDYSIKIVAPADGLNGIVFSETQDGTPLTDNTISGTIAYDENNAANMDKDITIFWSLPAGADNEADTAMAGKSATYTLDMNASQKTPTPITP